MRFVLKPLSPVIAAALCAGAAGTGLAAPGGGRGTGTVPASPPVAAPVLQVATGRGKLVTLARPMTDLFVADPTIADVQVRSPTQLYVFAKKAGETTLSATGRGGQVVYAATVRVASNVDSIGTMLRLAMPEAQLTATPMNGLVLLTGTVASPQDAAEAERLVQAFVGTDLKVLSRVKTATPLQVNLRVRFAEVSRSFIKNIGANLQTFSNTGGAKFGLARGRDASSQYYPYGGLFTGGATPSAGQTGLTQGTGSTLGLAAKALGINFLSSLDLGETIGQVTTLAEPNGTTLSGETATFLAGGEIPIPVSQGLGAVSVEYKQYGVSIAYTPTVLADGRISMRIRSEVSQLSSQGAVTISGTTIPALSTRRIETSAELGSGESMVVGGLLQNDHNNSIEKTPGLGDVPVLGALFRSNAWQRNETELVVVITPYLVKPVNANDIVLPTDGYKAPTDVERVLLGELGGGTTGGDRPKPTVAPPVTGVPAQPLTGAPTQPALGAIAPVAPQPAAPDPRPARGDKTRDKKEREGADAAPGFTSN